MTNGSGPYHALVLCVLLLAPGKSWAQSSASDEAPTDGASSETQIRARALAAEVERAVEHIGHKRFAEALVHFDQAARLTEDPEQLSTLEFNAGVCLFELGRFSQAEARFLAAGAANRSAEAFVHAGFAASRRGDVASAKRHASVAQGLAPSARERALLSQLEQELSVAERHARQREFAALLRAAFRALDHEGPRQVLATLLQAAALLPVATTEQKANYHYALALAHHQLGDAETALREVDQAATLEPTDAEFVRYRGVLNEQLGNANAAASDYVVALDVGLPAELARATEAALVRLHPLKAPGWQASALASLGYDTNATQSGSAFARGLANQSANVASPLALLYLELGHRFRLDSSGTARDLPPSWDLVPTVSLTNFTLTQSSVRELSLVAVGANVRLQHASSLQTAWSFDLGVGAAFAGWLPTTPFTRDVSLGVGFSTRTSPHWTTDAGASIGYVAGLGEDQVLTGPRLSANVGERFRKNAFSVFARASGTVQGLGTERFAASSEALPRCAGPVPPPGCAELTFVVPLAYVAPALTLGLDWSLGRFWVLQAQAGTELRLYLAPSTVETSNGAVPESSKRRRDLRPEMLVRGNYFLGAMSLFAEQSMLVSISNLEPDLANPAHRFDYEDRNYVQFVSRLGVRADW